MKKGFFKTLALLTLLTGVFAVFPRISNSTVSNTTTQTITGFGNGVTVNYTIGFDFRDNSVITVTEQDNSTTPPTQATIVSGSGAGKYTITGGNPGTTVKMGTAPTSNQFLIIQRNVPFDQNVSYDEDSAFPAADHEAQMDNQVFMIQDLGREVNKKVGLASTSSATGVPVLPDPVASRLVGYNSAGTDLTLFPSTALSLSANDVLQYNGTNWVNTQPSTFALSAFTGNITNSQLPTAETWPSSGYVTSSAGALTANLPVIGAGSGGIISQGTRSGNTTSFATTSGSLTSGHCLQVDASGNLVDSGAGCAGSAAGSNTQVQYNNAGLAAGSANFTFNSGTGGVSASGLNLSGLTASLPVVTDSSKNLASGVMSGSGTTFGSTFGTLTSGDCVKFDSTGNLVDAGAACASSSAAGSTTQIQYNNAGSFAGDSHLTYTKATGVLSASGANLSTLTASNVVTTDGSKNLVSTPYSGSGSTIASIFGSATSGKCVQFDAAGNLVATASACSSGGGTPGGSTTQVQFNDSGSFNGTSGLTFAKSTGVLSASGVLVSGLTVSKPVFTDGSDNLTSTGTVPVASGGTNLASGTSGGVLAFTGSTTLASSAALTAHGVVIGGGAGAVPTSTAAGTSGQPLVSGGSSADPAYATLGVSGGGTGLATANVYAVVVGGTTTTGALQQVSGSGTSGQVLTSNGASALPTWQLGTAGIVTPSSQASSDRYIRVRVAGNCTSDPCTIASQNGTTGVGVSAVNRLSTGSYAVHFTAGIFSVIPTCVATNESGGGLIPRINTSGTISTTQIDVKFVDDTGTVTDTGFHLHCIGPS